MAALPIRGNSTGYGNGTAATSWSSTEGNRKSCSSRGIIAAASTCWKTACQKKTNNKLAMTQYVAKKNNNILTCTEVERSRRSRGMILSLYPILRRHTCSAVSGAVLPDRRKRAYSSKLSKGPWRWLRAWSIWHMKRAWKKLHYSARRKECSGVAFFSYWYVYLIGRNKEGARLFSVKPSNWTRQKAMSTN